MNLKEKYGEYLPLLIKINNALLLIGLALISIGIGATYQAYHDVDVLNNTLYHIASTDGILTDGTTYYYVGLYENRLNFSSMDLINISICNSKWR